jgi:hypothetical protein
VKVGIDREGRGSGPHSPRFHSGAQRVEASSAMAGGDGLADSRHGPNVEASMARPGNRGPQDTLGARWKGPEGVGAWW